MAKKAATKFYYVSVLAEVLIQADPAIAPIVQKIQFFSKSDIQHFPLRRLQQLQNSAVLMMSPEGKLLENVVGVWLLNILPLGFMTDEQFEGAGATAQVQDSTTMVAANEPNPADQQ